MHTYSFYRLRAVMAKEMRHIVRDWQTLLIVAALPVIMMFLYGYALTMDMREAAAAVVDPSPTAESRAVARAVDATTIFRVVTTIYGDADGKELFRQNPSLKAVFRFSPDFGRDLRRSGRAGRVDIMVNGADPNQGTIIRNLAEGLVTNASLQVLGLEPPKVVTIQQQVLYNPQQKSALFFIPGLMALILVMISTLLTSLAITREKEHGTLEQLLVTPLRAGEIIVGKIVPYILFAALDGILILLVGRLAFGVTVSGSLPLLGLASLIYICTALALGLLFSTIARTQLQAMLMSLPATLLPTMILSGFIFPRASMPLFLQAISYLVPATYYLEIIRGIMLKGVGLAQLWLPFLLLGLQGLLLVMVSIRRFRVKL